LEADFSASVARARVAAGLSQEELARRVREYGLPFNVWDVQELEAGARPVRLSDAMILRMVLNVEIPEATKPVRHQMVHEAYSQTFAKASKEWEGIVKDLARCRQRASDALQNARYARSTYLKAIRDAEGESAPNLLASVEDLIKQAEAVGNSMAEVDSHLDGALSMPSARASLPGSQT
jgi:hypothetical protein